MEIFSLFPANVIKIVLVLGLAFLIGLEREEEKATRGVSYFFGGVRTFPLIGLIGFVLVLLSPESMLLFAVGFLVLGIILTVSYWSKIGEDQHGITSEMSGLVTFLIGGAVAKELYWIAIAIGIINLLLLQMKSYLEGLAKKIESQEITTLVQFLLLSIVILPVIPNVELTQFNINPYKTWLIVVVVSSIFYGTYLIDRFIKIRHGLFLSAIFGGIYSSTATTVVLAKKAKGSNESHAFSGAILVASGMMYLRLAVLIFFFNQQIFNLLGVWYVKLSLIAILAGTLWSKMGDKKLAKTKQSEVRIEPKNPLEIRTALFFALLFVFLMAATKFALDYFGTSGMFSLAAIMGTIDVDPFILGITQAGGKITSLGAGAMAILIASASNNIAKGIYAIIFANRQTGIQSFLLLAGLSAISFYGMGMLGS